MPEDETTGDTEKRAYRAGRRSFGAIEKRGKRFRARYVGPDGQTYTAPTTFTTKTDADGWLSKQRGAIESGKWKSPKQQKSEIFGAYAATWIEQRTTADGAPLRAKTRSEYRRYLDKSLHEFTADPIAGITPARVRAWHTKRAKEAPTGAAREVAFLRSVLSTAIEDGVIEKNPVQGKQTKTSAGVEHRPPTLEELAQLVQAMPELWRAAVVIAAYGGLRLSEWRALRRSDLRFDAEAGRFEISVNRQAQRVTKDSDDLTQEAAELDARNAKETAAAEMEGRPARLERLVRSSWEVGDPKSREGRRVVTLPAHLAPMIQAHLDAHAAAGPDGLLFQPGGDAEFIDDQRFNRPWNEARDAVGVRGEVREHDLRAFAATAFAQSGATLKETQAFLGHSTVAAAMTYQALTGREAELADRMPALPEVPAKEKEKKKTEGGEVVQITEVRKEA
ncbi:tyrosine-type recombinase/integrase [Gulosibacter molinativorax]|uniref:Tyr recombinase domain-containing protein n=1 Tax=Gulosibacter molinativorax TaxID=256821 RepID=A0ABT7CA23_9MICO|nr:tyrosine-type recombinase/integrase [Gulosibacter molinativorax]MDJ1372066.1 hypothetical protein [Gulosibacter molinativorax]QUY63885.1 Putative prophage phiRv2 integrase [Gulosibacter molinativorax]